jgi:hypothetical protein
MDRPFSALEILSFVAIMTTMFAPMIASIRTPTIENYELAATKPHLTWLAYHYYRIQALVFLGILLVLVVLSLWLGQMQMSHGVALTICSCLCGQGILDSVIAIKTGVYPIPSRSVPVRFIANDGPRLRRLGLYHLLFSLSVITAHVVGTVVYPGW